MNFFHYYKSRKGEILNLLKELVQLESPSTDRKAVNKCSSFLAQELKKNGAKITRYPQDEIGDLYLAEYPAKKTKERKEQILLLTHIEKIRISFFCLQQNPRPYAQFLLAEVLE